MDDILVIVIVALIVLFASLYVYKKRKAGIKCIGCPEAKTCSGNCGSCVTNK